MFTAKAPNKNVLNELPDAEAELLCHAKHYERNAERASTRAGLYKRNFETTLPFETAIIERYRRRESSIAEAMMEMYPAGVFVRRIEDITEALWGAGVSAGTISILKKKIYGDIEEWRKLPLEAQYPYIYMDEIWLKRSWGGTVENVSIPAAVGVNKEGYREIPGAAEGSREDAESRKHFCRYLKERGLRSAKLIISDKSLGILKALGDFFPDAHWQRCAVHFYRNVLSAVPVSRSEKVAAMLKSIHAQEDREAAGVKVRMVTEKLRELKPEKAAALVERGAEETFSYYDFPPTHWRSIRTNNPPERINREIRRRTGVAGNFPDGKSALMLGGAGLRYLAGHKWGTEFLVTRNQSKHPDRGCAKASHDGRISGRGEPDRASQKKCAKNSGRYHLRHNQEFSPSGLK